MLDGVMTICLHKSNYHPIFVSSHYRTIHRSNSNPAMVVKLSSVFLPAEESKHLPEPPKKITYSSINIRRYQTPALISQRNTVGIIGGFSAFSTLMFLEKFVWLSSRDGKECVPFIVCSDPALKAEFAVYSSLSRAKDVRKDLNQRAIIENLRRKRVFLEQSGAGCIVMPCYISHLWHKEVSRECAVTFLDVGDCVARELKEAKLKPLEAGSNVRIGILAADATLMAGFYQEKLQDQGFEVVLPDKPTMEHMVIPAIEALKKKDTEGARNLVRIAIHVLLVRAVNKIILASDEFQGLVPRNDPLLRKCIDPMDALARSTIKWAQSTESSNRT